MTPPRDALYRAICAHPDEDTPRLAFADLVEEDGDPLWAAFIRTQVELARVAEYDPLWAKCRQFHPEAIHGSMMAHTLPELPAGFSKRRFAFRRGFAWLVQVRNPDDLIGRADDLFAVAPVRALDFDDRSQPNLAALADCPHLRRLRRLEFTLARFDADEVASLGGSEYADHLTDLVFEQDAITADGLQALVASPLFARLEVLELRQNVMIGPELLVDALAAADGSANLRKLSAPFAGLTHDDAPNLFTLPVVRGLEHLDLRDNKRLGPEGAEALAESGAVDGLRVLNLSHTLPGVVGVKALTESRGLAGVRWLDLSANRLGPNAAKLLAGSRSVRGLRVLDLSNNEVGDTGAEALATSSYLAGLVDLDLSDAGVGDAGAEALARSPHLDGLLRLNLRDSHTDRPLGDEARRALVERFGPRVSFNEGS